MLLTSPHSLPCPPSLPSSPPPPLLQALSLPELEQAATPTPAPQPWPPGGPPSTPVPPQVHDLCDNFCHRYITCLKGKMPIDLVIEDRDSSCREDLDDYPASCPSLPDQVGSAWGSRHCPAAKGMPGEPGVGRAHRDTASGKAQPGTA